MTALDDRTTAVLALDEIGQWWAELVRDLQPGTARRWYQRDETPEQAQQREHEDAMDRYAKHRELWQGRTPNGFTASPVVDSVLDVKVEVEQTVTQLWLLVHDRIASSTAIEPWPVPRMTRWLADVLPGLDDAALIDRIGRDARRCAGAVIRGTGRTEPVLRIEGRCPTCSCVSLRAWPLREMARCTVAACGRVWQGKAELAWLSKLIGGPADPLLTPVDDTSAPSLPGPVVDVDPDDRGPLSISRCWDKAGGDPALFRLLLAGNGHLGLHSHARPEGA